MSEKVNVCEFCDEQPAAVLCSECCKCYCDRCNKIVHELSKKKGHKTEPIPEGVRIGAMCPIHNDALRLFCVDEVKLCCSTCVYKGEDLHSSHNVVKTTDINKDNETFSASEVREHFAETLKCDDELDKKIETTIENIKIEGNEIRKKVKQTFIEAHEKLEEEEAKITGELENVCTESEEMLQKHLDALKEVREYSIMLNDADTKTRGECSRLMELNLVSEMEKQRVEMERVHRTMMTDLKIGWDSEKRKLSFTRTLFNGAPIPTNVNFPSVFSKRIDISWECDEGGMSEENKAKTKYVAEVKKKDEREWREVYTGQDKKCNVTGLDANSEYDVRVKCVVGGLQGGWSDAASIRTKKLSIDSLILSQEKNKDALSDKLSEWCGTTDFELLYRGTRDGFKASDFHRTCDNKGKTLTLIKNTNGHVFGGFASIPWTSPSSGIYKQAPGSFIFTLTNMHRIQPTKFSLKNENDGHAVCHNSIYGPVFGNTSSGDGIWVYSNCDTNKSSLSTFGVYNDTTGKGNSIFSSSTSNPTSNSHFQAQDIEVFKVNV